MRLVEQTRPTPRLLSTVVPEVVSTAASTNARSNLERGKLFRGNGLAIFAGLLIGAGAIATVALLYERHTKSQPASAPVLMPVMTETVSASPHEMATPVPITVEIRAEHIRVTAI